MKSVTARRVGGGDGTTRERKEKEEKEEKEEENEEVDKKNRVARRVA